MRAKKIHEYLNFEGGGDAYNTLGIGKNREFKAGDKIRFNKELFYYNPNGWRSRFKSPDGWSTNSDGDFTGFISTRYVFTYQPESDKHYERFWNEEYYLEFMEIETLYAHPEWWSFTNNDDNTIYEVLNFERGGDPYKKLDIGQNTPAKLKERAEQHLQQTLDYYDSEDFKGLYTDQLYNVFLENEHYIIDRIIELMNNSRFINYYESEDLSYDDKKLIAPKIYDYIKDNFEDFVDNYKNYYVGDMSLEGHIFGEQKEEIEEFEVEVFEKEFHVNGTTAYRDLSSDGLHVNLLKSRINIPELI